MGKMFSKMYRALTFPFREYREQNIRRGYHRVYTNTDGGFRVEYDPTNSITKKMDFPL